MSDSKPPVTRSLVIRIDYVDKAGDVGPAEVRDIIAWHCNLGDYTFDDVDPTCISITNITVVRGLHVEGVSP